MNKLNFNVEGLEENRGGSRITPQIREISDSIIENIQQYKCQKIHHSRKYTGRCYLPPDINVENMWIKWKNDRESKNLLMASYSKYYDIFINEFNLSFGRPRQDVYSYCTEIKAEIGAEKDDNEKNS